MKTNLSIMFFERLSHLPLPMNSPPLVVHLVYRFQIGGLEMLLAECINRIPREKYRHVIVCLTDYTEFAKTVTKPDVEIFCLHKPPGLGLGAHVSLWKLLRRLRPTILHTYNLSTMEYSLTASLAGVPIRIHAEHGREASDPNGKNRKHNLLRRLLTPFIDCYIPVSADLQRWLKTTIGVPDAKNLLIHNGVDTENYKPGKNNSMLPELRQFSAGDFIIGTVGRIQDVKDHHGLIDAFILLRELIPAEKQRLRLVIVGDGPLLSEIRIKITAAGVADLVWLPGARNDIAEILRTFSVFTLPSIAEGTPVSILEAMSTGLAVVASRVGGIPEVVIDNVTGMLVPASDPKALATALATYYRQPALAAQHGAAGRDYVEKKNSMTAMLSGYTTLYDSLCKSKSKTKYRNQ